VCKTLNRFELSCDSHFQHGFTACVCILKVNTLVWANQDSYFETANACSKRMLKTIVATQLDSIHISLLLTTSPANHHGQTKEWSDYQFFAWTFSSKRILVVIKFWWKNLLLIAQSLTFESNRWPLTRRQSYKRNLVLKMTKLFLNFLMAHYLNLDYSTVLLKSNLW